MDHALQHLGGDDHRDAAGTRRPHQSLLHNRHVFGGQLNAEVAARHHDPVTEIENFIKSVEGGRLLDLG